MEAGGFVPAHAAQLVAQHLRSRALLSLALRLLCRVWNDWGEVDGSHERQSPTEKAARVTPTREKKQRARAQRVIQGDSNSEEKVCVSVNPKEQKTIRGIK